MRRTILAVALVWAVIGALPGTPASASSTIELRSGGAPVGSVDPITDVSLDGGASYADAFVVSAHPAYSTIPGTRWISFSPSKCCAPQSVNRYRATFELPARFTDAALSVSVHADNAAEVQLNGQTIGSQPNAEIFQNFQNPAENFSTSNQGLFLPGSNAVEFLLTNYGDPSGLDYLATVTFIEIRNAPPDCSTAAASQAALWPPNHKMQSVSVSGATDPDGDEVSVAITGVTQDEPVAGPGNHDPDAASTASSGAVELRAERDGTADGRVYRIAFTADDGNGGTCSGTAVVGVPHDMDGDPAVDSTLVFDSFGS